MEFTKPKLLMYQIDISLTEYSEQIVEVKLGIGLHIRPPSHPNPLSRASFLSKSGHGRGGVGFFLGQTTRSSTIFFVSPRNNSDFNQIGFKNHIQSCPLCALLRLEVNL